MSTKRISAPSLPKHHLKPGEIEWTVPAAGALLTLPSTSTEPIIIRLVHPESCVRIQATQQLTGDSEGTLALTVVHEAAFTQAEIIIKSVLQKQATARVTGMISILPNTKGVCSYFNHHSLVFDSARVTTIPGLEIANNEVSCSHAATIRTITEADRSYARSRGLTTEEATDLLITAFLATL